MLFGANSGLEGITLQNLVLTLNGRILECDTLNMVDVRSGLEMTRGFYQIQKHENHATQWL